MALKKHYMFKKKKRKKAYAKIYRKQAFTNLKIS